MDSSRQIKRRKIVYALTFIGLFFGHILLRDSQWIGNKDFHTLMEFAATLLATMVGVVALIHYYTKKESHILFIGVGFLGTAFLDLYHGVVISHWFDQLIPFPPASLLPWSWVSSRFFLSVFMFVSWWVWKRQELWKDKANFNERYVYIGTGVFTLLSFTFFVFYPLPRAYFPEIMFGRPEEFIPALFFLLALIGYLKKGNWKTNNFEHWFIISLIVGFMSQVMFMSFSFRLFDVMFDTAHMLKKASYVCVLTGLLISMFNIFKNSQQRTKAMQMLRDMSVSANEANTVDELAPKILERMCCYMNWSIGHIYQESSGMMVPTNFWHMTNDTGEFDIFKRVTMETTFESGIGLPGRVLESGKPAWIIDVTKDPNYPRAKLAENLNVKAGICFPVFIAGKVVMVLEFYSKDALPPNDILLEIMESIGSQVGQIIERQQAEKILTYQKDALDQHSIVAITDVSGKITYVNDKFCEISKYSRSALLGQDHRIINSGYHPKEFIKDLWRVIANGKVWKGAIRNKAKDGRCYWVDTSIVPFLGQDGKPNQYLAIRTDITDQKEVEQKLKMQTEDLAKKNEDLRNLDQLKDELLSTVSHELRTPLAISKEATSLVLDEVSGPINEKQKKYLTSSHNNLIRLNTIIDDFLDMSKIEAGKVKLKRGLIDISALLKDFSEDYQKVLKAKNQKLIVNIPQEAAYPFIDSDKILQVITNFLNNAHKFTPEEGNIELSVEVKDEEVVFYIKDDGIGVAPEDLPKLFGKFEQINRKDSAGIKGTGLGLAISKSLIELHGGRVWAESEEGKGTIFSFTLPTYYEQKKKFDQYVEDLLIGSQQSKESVAFIMLHINNFDEIRKKYSEQKLVEINNKILKCFTDVILHPGDKFILYDIHTTYLVLPDTDQIGGQGVIQKIKKYLKEVDFSLEEKYQLNLNYSFALYPRDAKTREELIHMAFKHIVRKKNILVVDDDSQVMQIFHSRLKNQNYVLSFADSGEEALKLIKVEKPDLIILDIMMPHMNGYELMGRLRLNKDWSVIPIIILTAKTEETVKEEFKDLANIPVLEKSKGFSEAIKLIKVMI